MSAKITNFTNKKGETTGTISFDAGVQAWRIASKAEPSFQQMFPSEQKAFYFWYSRFDPQTGKLRHFEQCPTPKKPPSREYSSRLICSAMATADKPAPAVVVLAMQEFSV